MADSKNRKTVDVFRSSVTGEFVRERYAKDHPKITEHERIKKKD